MKKMIVIAALIGGMLMPAQIMAQRNNRNEKPRVENRDNRKDMKPGNGKGGNKEMNFNKPGKKEKPGFAMNKPGRMVIQRSILTRTSSLVTARLSSKLVSTLA